MKIKSILITCSFISLGLLLSSNIGYENAVNTPGRIEFIGDAGGPNVFVFNKWAFTKVAIPENKVENIQVELTINTSSLSTDWKDLETNIRNKKDYFYVKKFPEATVKINGAKAMENGQYTTDAVLTLKGKQKPVTLTFTISDTAPYQVKGSGIIQRKAFNFKGKGPKWEVPVSFDVVLPLEE